MSKASYRTILRSSSIMGGAQATNIAASLVKMKLVALLLGPLGVGLAGLYLNLIQTAATIAALGLGNAGTRQIAAADTDGDGESLGRIRHTLFWAIPVLALAGAVVFWLASGWIARIALGDDSKSTEISWLALGVALTVAAGSQTALLTGLRRISDLARVQAGAGIASAGLGILAIWMWGERGLVMMVLAVPFMTLVLGHFYAARIPKPGGPTPRISQMLVELKAMSGLGIAVMLSALATILGHLVVRVLVQRELGSNALGHFQAAWIISVTYVSFVLGAMATDYFPRLSAAFADRTTANRLVNEQTEVALLLCGPLLLATLGLAPQILRLLYSSAFVPAADILLWQILGDILKVMSWPLGFALLAAGSGKSFAIAEFVGVSVFVAGVSFGLPVLGLKATGLSFFLMYVAYLPLVGCICARRFGIFWTKAVLVLACLTLLGAIGIIFSARVSSLAGAIAGVSFAGLLGLWAIFRLSMLAEAGGRLARLGSLAERINKWISK